MCASYILLGHQGMNCKEAMYWMNKIHFFLCVHTVVNAPGCLEVHCQTNNIQGI